MRRRSPPPPVEPVRPAASAATTGAAIAAVWRAECGRLVGALTRMTRDLGLAEECAQDALVAALERWPRDGLPENPPAWLMTTARHRALDHLRRAPMLARQHEALGQDLIARGAHVVPDIAEVLADAQADTVGDDLLRLMFIACHPVLSRDARVALTLRLLGGLTTDEIARAFLVPEATIAQRIVRAKKTLGAAGLPFALPPAGELAARRDAVHEVIYLIFNEGHAATAGDAGQRPALCEQALRLARVLAGLAPADAETAGLVALMELQAARLPARTDAAGEPVLLLEQDRRLWDRLAIQRGLAALAQAEDLAAGAGAGAEAAAPGLGAYTLQAEIAACHARAAAAADTDWPRIAALYAALARAAPSPVVELNRAVAVGMADGPAAGLAVVDTVTDDPRLQDYPWLHAVRGDLLARLGRRAEAAEAFARAAARTRNARERESLRARGTALRAPPGVPADDPRAPDRD